MGLWDEECVEGVVLIGTTCAGEGDFSSNVGFALDQRGSVSQAAVVPHPTPFLSNVAQ